MGGPPKKKKQHYVPRFVLRNFSPNGKSVPTLVLATGMLYEDSSIGDQCAENYFYGREPDMENAFAESETKVSTILRRVATGELTGFDGAYRTRTFPDTSEHELLRAHPLYAVREYVYYQAHRTLTAAEQLENSFDAEVKWWLRKDPRFKEQAPEAFESIDDVRIVPRNTIHHVLYHACPFSFALLDMTVKLLVLDKPGLVLSDNPVVLRNQYAEQERSGPGALGVLARGLQMFMPISPTMVVAIYDGDVYDCGAPDEVVVKLSARNAKVLNAMQVRNANECLYLHPDVATDREELRRTWQQRPDMTPRRVEGPMISTGPDTSRQRIYTLPPDVEPLPRLRCFQLCDRTTEEVRDQLGDLVSCPIRSLALANAVQELSAVIDWKVKESVIARGLPVSPEWQEWLDSIVDPRATRAAFRDR